MNKIIVILGPTGVGKTKLSVELAKEYNGEIMNADSMQFYKGLNIGTAKVLEEEKEGIEHHLFDILDVEDDYSIYNYQIDGRGLYVKALLYDYKLEKNKVKNNYDNYSTSELYDKLVKLDKNINIDKNNRRRVIRALDYYLENNKSISNNKTDKLLYDAIFIGLTVDRDILYKRINNRVDKMIEDGLILEVKSFYDKKIYSKPLINGIGYKELYEYFDGKVSLEDAVNNIKRNSRRYAKRQMTFFKHQLNVKWFMVDYNKFSNTVNDVIKYIDRI